jgi:hypothetical protein
MDDLTMAGHDEVPDDAARRGSAPPFLHRVYPQGEGRTIRRPDRRYPCGVWSGRWVRRDATDDLRPSFVA